MLDMFRLSISSSSAFSNVDLLCAVVLIDAEIGSDASVGHVSMTGGKPEDFWVLLRVPWNANTSVALYASIRI